MKKTNTKMFVLCLFCGLVFLAVGFYFCSVGGEFRRNGVKTQAEIVRIDKKYEDGEEKASVFVKYTVKNTEYESLLNYYSDFLREGDTVPILYLRNNPKKITYTKNRAVLPIAFFTGAGICFAFSAIAVIGIVRNNKIDGKRKSGDGVTARVTLFDRRENVRVLGKNPVHIICEDANGNCYETRFLYDGRRMIGLGSSVVVYVNQKIRKNTS